MKLTIEDIIKLCSNNNLYTITPSIVVKKDFYKTIKENLSSGSIILIDINNSIVAEGFCQEVLYLIEPSIIKLEKLMVLNATALAGLKGKKIVLNQTFQS